MGLAPGPNRIQPIPLQIVAAVGNWVGLAVFGAATDGIPLVFGSACAVERDGRLFCWERTGNGGLPGSRFGYASEAPHQLATTADWSAVACGFDHSCATKSDGTVWCWGWNENGQLGTGTTGQIQPLELQRPW